MYRAHPVFRVAKNEKKGAHYTRTNTVYDFHGRAERNLSRPADIVDL